MISWTVRCAAAIGGAITVAMLICVMGCNADTPNVAVANETPASDTPLVPTLKAPFQTVRRTTTQPATLHAFYEAKLYAKVTGYLEDLRVDIGDHVKKGDVLAVIAVPEMQKQLQRQQATVASLEAAARQAESEISVAKASMQAAKANRNQATAEIGKYDAMLAADEIEFGRVSDLVDRQAVANRMRDESEKRLSSSKAAKVAAEAAAASAESQVSVAQAKIEAAEAQKAAAQAQTDVAKKQLEEQQIMLDYAQLLAPFDGVVTERNVGPGDLVRNQSGGGISGAALFTVVRLDKIRVRVAVPENEAPFADAGDKATIQLRGRSESVEGTVSRVAGGLDPATRSMLVEIELDNADGKLLPGLYGSAEIMLEERPDAVVVPAGAVRHDETGSSFVYVVADGVVHQTTVQTGYDDGQQIEIVDGLTGGEQIVGAMLGRLQDGQKVSPQAE